MDHVLEAIYESGVFKPLETIHLSEHQRVLLTIHSLLADSPHTKLEAWQQVYAGLSDQDITEIEAIALDRSRFLAQDD
ncbi:MAG: antitoxin family protein [Candidatus Binatia bacterium]